VRFVPQPDILLSPKAEVGDRARLLGLALSRAQV